MLLLTLIWIQVFGSITSLILKLLLEKVAKIIRRVQRRYTVAFKDSLDGLLILSIIIYQ